MSKRNRHKTSEPTEEVEFYGLEEPADVEEPVDKVVGMVTGCRQLNIRREPKLDADVLCYVPVNSELMIDTTKSTDEWLHVCTIAGVDGYCMSKYVFIKQ